MAQKGKNIITLKFNDIFFILIYYKCATLYNTCIYRFGVMNDRQSNSILRNNHAHISITVKIY